MTTLTDLIAQARPPTLLLDALATPPAVCACGRPGAKPRHWNSPQGRRAGYFCDPCDAKVALGRLWLRADNLHEALNAVLGAVA
jgi:hypothetical protein